jgi:hypothetical protein
MDMYIGECFDPEYIFMTGYNELKIVIIYHRMWNNAGKCMSNYRRKIPQYIVIS